MVLPPGGSISPSGAGNAAEQHARDILERVRGKTTDMPRRQLTMLNWRVRNLDAMLDQLQLPTCV